MYRKVTNADVYLNWNSFVLQILKRGTIKTLSQREYMICFIAKLCDTELKLLEKVFAGKNNYLKRLIRQVFTQLKFNNCSNLLPPTIETIEHLLQSFLLIFYLNAKKILPYFLQVYLDICVFKIIDKQMIDFLIENLFKTEEIYFLI